jgi:hypothetical protein
MVRCPKSEDGEHIAPAILDLSSSIPRALEPSNSRALDLSTVLELSQLLASVLLLRLACANSSSPAAEDARYKTAIQKFYRDLMRSSLPLTRGSGQAKEAGGLAAVVPQARGLACS